MPTERAPLASPQTGRYLLAMSLSESVFVLHEVIAVGGLGATIGLCVRGAVALSRPDIPKSYHHWMYLLTASVTEWATHALILSTFVLIVFRRNVSLGDTWVWLTITIYLVDLILLYVYRRRELDRAKEAMILTRPALAEHFFSLRKSWAIRWTGLPPITTPPGISDFAAALDEPGQKYEDRETNKERRNRERLVQNLSSLSQDLNEVSDRQLARAYKFNTAVLGLLFLLYSLAILMPGK
jgi:hypothetical protein